MTYLLVRFIVYSKLTTVPFSVKIKVWNDVKTKITVEICAKDEDHKFENIPAPLTKKVEPNFKILDIEKKFQFLLFGMVEMIS